MCQWRNFKSSFNKCLSLALREMNTGTNSPAAHNCVKEITVKGFYIIRLNPNNQIKPMPCDTSRETEQVTMLSHEAEAYSPYLFPLPLCQLIFILQN